jgi:hypothetical protein
MTPNLNAMRQGTLTVMSPEELAEQYERSIGPVYHSAERPTFESVATIEAQLGCKLPNSLVRFASAAPNYGNWLASIGPDYDSPTHILKINSDNYIQHKPGNFVIINIGFDEDYECMDTQTYHPETDEYLITYWSPDVPLRESELFDGFLQCMGKNISFWQENT